jgi:hypothetical protein
MDFYEPLQKIRDYFVLVKEPAKAELCNSILAGLDDENHKNFIMNKDEVQAMVTFLYDVGYISYEKHAEIHVLSKRMEQFLGRKSI